VVLGVCGSIAAYKVVDVCRQLIEAGAHVAPVMTDDATRFLGPATLSALASEAVHTSLWTDRDPIPHTRLGRSADLVIVAPATARVIGSYVAGISDDLLTATLLATAAPVVVCPAMHTEMWEHPAVRHNVSVLRSRGVRVVDPDDGRLAGGDEGPGRLAATGQILAAVDEMLAPHDLVGRKVLVTAGGTREPVDPVRFVGNRSSGKQGHALADEAAARGAHVMLVTTVDLPVAAGVDVVRVETAAEMERAVLQRSPGADAVLMAAAVADFRPSTAAGQKLPKADGPPPITLEPTTDILAALGGQRTRGQVLVGFAAETASADLRQRAGAKLAAKGVDLMVANDVSAVDAGFESDDNRVVMIDADGTTSELPLMPKRAVATHVLDAVVRHLSVKTN
jgi:phosphopantothenoylcysteine decarboxylase/phosphopantothenate--cysteine ligase